LLAVAESDLVWSDKLAGALSRLSFDNIAREYWEQDEFVFVPNALPQSLIDELVAEYRSLGPRAAHRSWIPRARKAGTVGYGTIQRQAPRMAATYQSRAMLELSSRLAKKDLVLKHANDDHAAALYVYDHAGDGINYHYDTCGCEMGASYAIIIGLINQSSSVFAADLYKRTQSQPIRHVAYATPPGSMLLFCGDNVWHEATPVRDNEERVVLCLSYVMRGKHVQGFKRFTENIRDAFFYFGPSSVFQKNYRTPK
jgi:hypothetical protein